MGIGGDDDDDDDGEEDVDDDDDDDEDEEDDDEGGVGLTSDLDEDEDETKEEGWGKKKSDYYDADEADDSEAEEEEEKEALRLRAKQSALLKAEDFGEDDVASSDEDDTIAAALSDKSHSAKRKEKSSSKDKQKGKLKDKNKSKAVKTKGAIALDEELEALEDDDDQVEKVERDLSGLSEEERLAILENDSPELLVLLGDFTRYIKEVRAQLLPVRERVKSGSLPTASGVSYLEVKLQLLLSYCTNVAFYLLLKAEGRAVKNHPVIEQLVELRTLMEKMRPLDAKLKYQMDKLLRTPLAGAAGAAGDALRFKPNPDALLDGVGGGGAAADGGDSDGGGGGDGGAAEAGDVYRPPRITAMHFEDKEEAKARRAREKKAARARKSEIVQALREEFDDAPVEMPNIGSAAQYRDKEEEHRTRSADEIRVYVRYVCVNIIILQREGLDV